MARYLKSTWSTSGVGDVTTTIASSWPSLSMSPNIGANAGATVKDLPNSAVINCCASGGAAEDGTTGCWAYAASARQSRTAGMQCRIRVLYPLARAAQVTIGSLL